MHTAATASESGFDLTIKRNCSISPQDLLGVLALAMCVSFGIACAFAWFGAGPVLPFPGIEMLALAAPFYVKARRASLAASLRRSLSN